MCDFCFFLLKKSIACHVVDITMLCKPLLLLLGELSLPFGGRK